MKILVTGSTGMVGRNFIDDPRVKKYELLLPQRSDLDLTNAGDVLAYFKKYQPDMVVHCASRVGGIAANLKYPVEFLSENIDISKNVIMAAYKTGVKKFLNLSSSCVYPRFGQNPLKETQILTGELEPTNEGYAIAKIAALKLCSFISKENPECQYRTLIPCNLYGIYDHFDPGKSHMIPAVILKIFQAMQEKKTTVEIWGDGTARREFMFTSDVVNCMYQCIEKFETVPDLMNVGISRDYSITEYYQAIADVIGYNGNFSFDKSKPIGMRQKLVDSSIVSNWGWSPQVSLNEGLQKTYTYFLKGRSL